jgi:hypothetical protein
MPSHALMAFLIKSDGLGIVIRSELLSSQAKESKSLFKITPHNTFLSQNSAIQCLSVKVGVIT